MFWRAKQSPFGHQHLQRSKTTYLLYVLLSVSFTLYYVPITAKMVVVPSPHFHVSLTQLLEFASPFVDKGKAKNLLTRTSAKGAQKLLQFSRNQQRIMTGCQKGTVLEKDAYFNWGR